jgi:hypothetical protein
MRLPAPKEIRKAWRRIEEVPCPACGVGAREKCCHPSGQPIYSTPPHFARREARALADRHVQGGGESK